MGRPRTVSDDAILEAARAVFLEHGSSVSTTAIAERIGLSQAALFKRFGTKQDLLVRALAPPGTPPFVARLEAGPNAESPPRIQLRDAAREIARFFRDLVPCLMVLGTSGMHPTDVFSRFDVPPPVRAQAAVAGWFVRAMESGLVRQGNPEAFTFSFLGALHMRAFMTHVTQQPFDDEALDAYVDSVVDSLWHGLAPETP